MTESSDAGQPSTWLGGHSTGTFASATSSPRSNPLYNLVDGLSSIAFAFFSFIRAILAFATVTIPQACFTVLHYSLTLQITFPSLLVLFLGALIAGLLYLRYRHRSYERLKEQPIKTDEGFNLHPDLNQETTGEKQGPFHSYLDDFLQAIRIFGFLEKPVSQLKRRTFFSTILTQSS